MGYCNHKWWSPLVGEISKTYVIRKSYKILDTPICLDCGMSQVYHEYITRMLKARKPCRHCEGRGYI